MCRVDGTRDRFAHQALVYPGAGHGVGTVPYLAQGTRLRHPATGDVIVLGGSRSADAAARAQGWPKVLNFLAALER
jgi:dienelactone hydrolase